MHANARKNNIRYLQSELQHYNNSSIGNSGNSDVDVNVHLDIDTMPIALALLCQSLATNQLSRKEFEQAVTNLLTITKTYKQSKLDEETNPKNQLTLYVED